MSICVSALYGMCVCIYVCMHVCIVNDILLSYSLHMIHIRIYIHV